MATISFTGAVGTCVSVRPSVHLQKKFEKLLIRPTDWRLFFWELIFWRVIRTLGPTGSGLGPSGRAFANYLSSQGSEIEGDVVLFRNQDDEEKNVVSQILIFSPCKRIWGRQKKLD